jgi:hypothetical protein
MIAAEVAVTDTINGTNANLREMGLEALRTRRYRDAVEHLSNHFEIHPDDVEASMELALAELLLGQRLRFACRYEMLSARFAADSPPTHRARMLWERCRRIGESMATAAIMLTAAGISATSAGCAKASTTEQAPPATVGVPLSSASPDPASPDPTVATPDPTVVTPEPTKEAVEEPRPDETAPGPTASAPPATPAPTPTPTRNYPKTRYVAVRPDPVPNLIP